MHGTWRTLILEPGEVELVRKLLGHATAAASDVGAAQSPAVIILGEVAAALSRLVAGPAPPLLVLRAATKREAAAYARRVMPHPGQDH